MSVLRSHAPSVQVHCSSTPARPTNNTTNGVLVHVNDVKMARRNLLGSAALTVGGVTLQSLVPSLATAAEAPSAAAGVGVNQIVDLSTVSEVVLSTLSDCDLRVGIYPKFSYNASGGGATGKVSRRSDGLLDVSWDASSLNIPAISYASTRILGLPLPPPLQIKIVPEKLEGTVDPVSGEANLDFLARFEFTAGSLYTAAPLTVLTTLTSETSQGQLLSGTGSRLAADGKVRLAGVARVPKTDTDALLDTFLMLPTDALAVLSAELKFQ